MRRKCHFLYAIVLPLGDGADVQAAERVFLNDCRLKADGVVCLPIPDILACIERKARLRQTEVGRRAVSRSVGRVNAAEPAPVAGEAEGRAVEPELGLAAALVGETVLAKVPE